MFPLRLSCFVRELQVASLGVAAEREAEDHLGVQDSLLGRAFPAEREKGRGFGMP